MGVELDIDQELASICVALTEISAISSIVLTEIGNKEFKTRYNTIIESIAKCTDVVSINLQPFVKLDTQAALLDNFDTCHDEYTTHYLKEISKPRSHSDQAYEEYLLLRTLKECKTGFPLLKRTFERLDKFVDKWITNDAWLAMGIDNLFKRLQALFNEVAQIKKKDPDDAFVIYTGAFQAFSHYLEIIDKLGAQLHVQFDSYPEQKIDIRQYSSQP